MTCYLARLLSYRCRLSGERERGAMTTDPGDRSGSGMAQHEPLARIGGALPKRTAEKCHNRTHAVQQISCSITASARASSEKRIVRPSALVSRIFSRRQYLRTKSIKPQFPNGIVSSVSFVSTTNTARSLAGFVSLALALTPWRSRFSASIFDIPLTRGKVYRPPLDSR